LEQKQADVDELICLHRQALSQVFTGLNERVASIACDLKESKFV
jgi:hypothetical protein